MPISKILDKQKPPDPSAAAAASSNQSLDRFRTRLGETEERLDPIAQMLIDRGLGTETDPLIEAQRNRATEQQRGALSKQGITGSTAIDQLNRTNSRFDESALGRRDQSLEAGLNLNQSLLQNTAGLSALDTSRLSALKSGGGGGGKK